MCGNNYCIHFEQLFSKYIRMHRVQFTAHHWIPEIDQGTLVRKTSEFSVN